MTEHKTVSIDQVAVGDTLPPLDIDVTDHLKPGKINTIALLVNTNAPGRSTRGGLYRRAFVWSPVQQQK